MKRHPALVALSHDHHHALVAARRLRRAADADDSDASSALADFARFFANVTVPHFREEEEVLFPLVRDRDEARPLVVQALRDHQRLRALAAGAERPAEERALMRELATLLEEHVRLEERRLFPLIEQLVGAELEPRVSEARRRVRGGEDPVVRDPAASD